MTRREWYILGRAIVRGMRDSEQTTEVHRVEELTGRARFKQIRASDFEGAEARELLRDRPELRSDQVDYDALAQLPEGTFGRTYADHLSDNGLSADYQAAPTRYIDDDEMSYLMRRFRQTHDVWHALTGLGTQPHEEVIIHSFSWGQLRLPVSMLVIIGGTLKHLIGEGRWGALRYAMREAYDHGLAAAPLLPVYWERYWETSLEQVRRNHGVTPCTRALVDG